MTEPQQPSTKSNATIIWDAITELSNAERCISRQVLRDITGLKITIIDDHVERLDANNKIRRVGGGILEVVEVYPPARPISVTELTNGWVNTEIGDTVLLLQPIEARKYARLLAGYNVQLDEIDRSNHALYRTAELANQVRELRAEIAALKRA